MTLKTTRCVMLCLTLIAVHTLLLLVLVVVLLVPDWLEDARQPFRCPLSAVERRLLSRTLQTLTSALDAANITYFMIGGTLIGSYRHHDRIPWDDDVDLIIPASEQSRLRLAVASVEPDFRLLNVAAAGCQWKFYLSTPVPGSHRPWFSLSSARWPYVDVFLYEKNATHVWNTCSWFTEEIWPLWTVFPLRRRPFGHLWLPAPCDTAAMLAVNFDTNRCQSREYDHRRSGPLWLWLRSAAEVDCWSLETTWPFVRRRRWTDQSGTRHVTETLWAAGGHHTLREVTLVDQCL